MLTKLITVVVPVYNETKNIIEFNNSLNLALSKLNHGYEIIYVDDGSTDDSAKKIADLCMSNIHLLCLSRNFGKEIALSAGIAKAKGDAIITIDADGQHPVDIIQQFVDKWISGCLVVVGIRQDNLHRSYKKYTSKLFYKLFNLFSAVKLIPNSTDFRLIDRQVANEFIKFSEPNRITRGLIDWLGFDRQFVYFKSNLRQGDSASYSFNKLIKLAFDSLVSMSPLPLYIFGVLGIFITPLSLIMGIFVIFEQLVLNDPLGLKFTGTAMLGVLIIFLVGLLLLSQGVIGIYLSHIQNQVVGRPLFVINYRKSVGFGYEK